MKLRLLLLLFVCGTGNVFSATVLKGNSGTTTTTFDFTVGPYNFFGGSSNPSMITGAGEAVSGNIFSVASYAPLVEQFIPIGVSTVTLNNTANQPNPLTGQQIKFINVHGGTLFTDVASIVIDKQRISTPVPASERFIVLSNIELPDKNKPTETKIGLLQSDVPNDAGGAASGYIVGMTSGVSHGAKGQDLIFGAVTQQSSNFGTGNSGIAIAQYQVTTNKDGTKTGNITLCNAQTGGTGNNAALFNASTSALKIGDNVTFDVSTFPVVDMYWDAYLQRLYIAVCVQAASGASNGARSIVVGRLEGLKLIFDPIVPDTIVLNGADSTIVGASNGGNTSIYKVRTMHTSTGLIYLIVNGGYSADSGIQPVANRVFALPLVDLYTSLNATWLTSSTQGTIAAKDQIPVMTYNAPKNYFIARQLQTPATTLAQMPLSTDTATIVGAGVLPLIPTTAPSTPALISNLAVYGDSVYAYIAAAYSNSGSLIQEPGIFQSHAIFDHYGRITAWTPWQRVGGSDDYAYGAGMAQQEGSFWTLTGADSTHVNTVKKTLWGNGAKDGLLGGTSTDANVGLVNVLLQLFPAAYGGIQVFNDFDAYVGPSQVPHSGLTGYTVQLAAGYQKWAFILTGDSSQANGTIKPYTGDFATGLATGTNDTFPAGSGKIFTVTGNVISGLGGLTTQTVFADNTNHLSWIALGGTNGLAILSNEHGYGYGSSPSSEQRTRTPATLPVGFTFKRAGNYRYVQKVLGDGYYLYVLTNKTLERIVIDPTTFVSGTLNSTVIATTHTLGLGTHGAFTDLVIGNKLALLATSGGLFRIANGCSVKVGAPAWTHVPLGESLGPVYSLTYASPNTDYNTGLASAGQLFALGAYQGFDCAQLYRLYTHEGSTLDDTCIQNISDEFVKDKPSYFVSFGQFQNSYADDGTLRLSTRAINAPRTFNMDALPMGLRLGNNAIQYPYSTEIFGGYGEESAIWQPLRSSASGAWIIPGNYGVYLNE